MTHFLRITLLSLILAGGVAVMGVAQPGQSCFEDLFPKKDPYLKLWGYVTLFDEWLIPAKYTKVQPFIGDRALVMMGDRIGAVDCKGNVQVPVIYDEIKPFNNHKAWVLKDHVWQLIWDNGTQAYDGKFEDVKKIGYENDYVWLKKNNVWGLFDESKLKFVANPVYDEFQIMTPSLSAVRVNGGYNLLKHWDGKEALKTPAEQVRFMDGDMVAYKRGGFWGLLNETADTVLACKYDSIGIMTNALFLVSSKGKYGISNYKGHMVLPMAYDEIGEYKYHMARVKYGKYYGFINRDGRVVIPVRYVEATEFSYYCTVVQDDKGKFGVLSNLNKWILPPSYKRIMPFSTGPYFAAKKDTAFTLINIKGDSLKGQYFDTLYVSDSIQSVRAGRFGKLGYFDFKTSAFSVPPVYDSLVYWYQGFSLVKKAEGWGAIDKLGQVVVPCQYSRMAFDWSASRTVFRVWKGKKQGITSVQNQTVLGCEYDLIVISGGKYYKVKKEGMYGVYKHNGEVLVPVVYEYISNAVEEKNLIPEWPAMVKKGGKWGLIGETGMVIFEPTVYAMAYAGEGIYIYKTKKKYGLLRSTGEVVGKAMYDDIRPFSEKYAAAKVGDKWGFVNVSSVWAVQPTFDEVWSFSKGGYACVKQGNLWGTISKNGQWITQPTYERIEQKEDSSLWMYKDGKAYAILANGKVK